MLALKLGLSLNTIRPYGEWTPQGDANLVAWYANKRSIVSPSGKVTDWGDSSGNGHTMRNITITEQPTYNASTGTLSFDPTKTQNLQSASQISLSGEFTIGIKLNPDAVNITVLADNTTSGEFIKIQTSNKLRIKIDNTQADISLNSGSFGDDYLVITRNSSNVITLYQNGTAQTDTETLSGTADIDNIGVRNTDQNPYDGDIKEIQIYDKEDSVLTTNVNNYLANL
jgi:hypothetical protein